MNLRHVALAALLLLSSALALPGHAAAAIELVGTTTASGAASNFAMGLTLLKGGIGSAPAQGDLVIIVDSFASTTNGDPGVTTAGYTEVADLYANDTNDINLSADYKVMGASPDTTVTCKASLSATISSVCYALVFRGVDTTTPLDVTTTSITGTNAEDINCPSITPVTSGAVVVCAGGAAGSAVPSGTFTWPTGYTQAANISSDPGSAALGVGAYTNWGGSGAEDPAAFVITMGTTAQDAWAAATLALRPAITTSAPDVSTNFATNVSDTSALLGATLNDTGGASVTQHGFAYSTDSALSASVSTTTDGALSGTGDFSTTTTGLSAGTTYYFRAYATNSSGMGYGAIHSFTAGTIGATRKIRLFEGYTLKVISGKIILYQK